MSDDFVILLGWLGLYAAVGLAAVGSAIGCTIAGQAAIGAMVELKGGYGRFVGLSALPSSFSVLWHLSRSCLCFSHCRS